VEPPGIAPGSSPLITCAFIPIVRANPNGLNIGAGARGWKAVVVHCGTDGGAGRRRQAQAAFGQAADQLSAAVLEQAHVVAGQLVVAGERDQFAVVMLLEPAVEAQFEAHAPSALAQTPDTRRPINGSRMGGRWG
jgi:hypothetical protein